MRESPESGIVVDTSQFPVLIVWFGRRYTDSDWEVALNEVWELAGGKRSFVALNVSHPNMDTPTARQRKAVADWNVRYLEAGHDTILGWGSVIQSHVLRGVLTAISWLTTFPYEQKMLGSLDEGVSWARQLLAKEATK